MRVTYYDKDGKVTETKDFGDKASDVVLNYDDTKLFFQIPESILKSARSKKDKLERLYLLDQLRFLIEYDLNFTLSLNCVTNRMAKCRAILGILAVKILRGWNQL